MAITILSSQALNQDCRRAMKAAQSGPVFITDRGKPTHVLLSIQMYQKLTKESARIADLLAMAEDDAMTFDPPLSIISSRAADLS